MKIINAQAYIESDVIGEQLLKSIERYGRVCYKSEDKITDISAQNFAKSIMKMGHESVIEHCSVTVRVICDRGVSHEIVRHRIASYSQESTRYCNYSNEKFGNELVFIKPCFWTGNSAEDAEMYRIWEASLKEVETNYLSLISLGATPQEARTVLPNSLKTEIVMTMNLREWRHFLKLRTDIKAHPQMREVANIILREFKERIPVIFDDIDFKIS
ncbi:FAD-dependent thymidylate synthase [Pelosinus sp. UFO1]|uniref:FAD-dependent thymidylate synthase n=1 Tax=Pelosinus sp. UFO1 TaxID=484770 RepID=UPI0004D13130|nr:FAD-dependent thymidylate synthase [Pelosinus sp. UFO1]AIF53522.1 thymidylate synthase, flavin-dependent [Pelosinus sp. UFO1]